MPLLGGNGGEQTYYTFCTMLPDDVDVMVSTGSRVADPQRGGAVFLSVGFSFRLLAQVQRKSSDESVGANAMSASTWAVFLGRTGAAQWFSAPEQSAEGNAAQAHGKGRLLIDGEPRGAARRV